MNMASLQVKATLRQTVVGLFYCIGSGDEPLIGIHWPAKAAQAAEGNLSLVSGPWPSGVSIDSAIKSHVQKEYGYDAKSVLEITPIEHGEYFSEVNNKQYHWCLVLLKKSAGSLVPTPSEVASFGWYGPKTLQSAIDQMHSEKRFMFRRVLQIGIEMEPVLRPFRKQFGMK